MSNENDKGDPLADLFKRVAKSTAEVFEPPTVDGVGARSSSATANILRRQGRGSKP